MTLDDLRKIAEKMGSDKWVTVDGDVAMEVNECTCFGGDPVLGHEPLCGLIGIVEGIPEQLAKFIATFNPQKVLEMIDELDSYRRSLRKVVDRNVELAARLAAVEEVHERREYWTETGEDICDTCSRRKQNDFEYWPCDTIKAVRGE